jgi:hypothetical protein
MHRSQLETPKAGFWGANGRRVSPGRFRVVGCRAFRLDFAEGLGGEPEDAWSLSRGLVRSIQSHPALRKEVYEQYPALPRGPSKEIVARAIAESPDIDGIMLLVREYGTQKRNFRQTVLYEALRHASTGQRPSSHFRGMQEIFGIPSPELRKKLFALIPEGGSLSELAIDCLNAIDDIREHYGEAESEPRHPDITSGRSWPMVTDWRKDSTGTRRTI